jgi:HMG box factor
VIRRRVRKDDAEEEKCRSVAELLIKGKSGQALEQEIRNKIQRNNAGPASNQSVLADEIRVMC